MPDLTDSYCERCGARYVFSPPTPRNVSFKGARVLAKGLKNFVLNDNQSITDSLTQARHEDEHEDSTRATEAFHRTFNFCMTCRQYACDKCWNSRAGACLSCAPEPGFEPTAPEDHLIVRTPVARWDTDWSLFPDGPAVEPVSRPDSPAPFNAPIPLPEPRLPSKAPVQATWPTADLPDGLQTAASGASAKSGHRPSRKAADPATASLWPVADVEIAPEMALTPEELDSVESSLGQGGPSRGSAQGGPTAPESPLIGAPPEPATPDHVAATDSTLPSGWPSLAATWLPPSAPAREPAASADSATSSPTAQQSVDRGQKRSRAEPEPQLPPRRTLHLADVTPHPPPPIPQAPQAPSPGRTPVVAKLLGRHGSPAETPQPGQQRRAPARKSQPSGDPWPLATRWTERPVETGWDEPAPSAQPGASFAASSPAPTPVDAQPTASIHDEFDARSAVAARLSAVEADTATPGESAAKPPIPGFLPAWATSPAPLEATTDSTPQESPLTPPPAGPQPRQPARDEPAWPEADREVVRQQTLDTSERIGQPSPPAPTTQVPSGQAPLQPAPASWPPLGARYPAQADRGAPWPGPDVAPAPAVVAAQSVAAAPLAEMWAQSSQEVLSRGTVRVCHRCALPVSTQARFCRRCGTRQG